MPRPLTQPSPISRGHPSSSGVCHSLPPHVSPSSLLPTEAQTCLAVHFSLPAPVFLPVSQGLLPEDRLPCSLAGCDSMLGSCSLPDNLSQGSCCPRLAGSTTSPLAFRIPEATSQLPCLKPSTWIQFSLFPLRPPVSSQCSGPHPDSCVLTDCLLCPVCIFIKALFEFWLHAPCP